MQILNFKSRTNNTEQDCDDDGESAAGGRLLHMLEMMNVRNVMVVVSRCGSQWRSAVFSGCAFSEWLCDWRCETSLQFLEGADRCATCLRWYGGVLLGPQRFTVINNVARVLLEECGFDNRRGKESASRAGGGKKR